MNRHYQHLKRAQCKLVLWKHPIRTSILFLDQLLFLTQHWTTLILNWIWVNRCFVALLTILLAIPFAYCEQYIEPLWKPFKWWSYWLCLGILSSIGLGAGLPTFILFLGPFIAKVALAAQECGTVEFPSPPYPDDVICPAATNASEEALESLALPHVSIWTVVKKVQLEAMLWGAGTAIGELPPYLLARSSRCMNDTDDLDNPCSQFIKELIRKIGFIGIIGMASIPNPLFDIAGIVCGHFSVPFWTFFGATFIGKAVIKIHLQQLLVIAVCNKNLANSLVELISKYFPTIGLKIQKTINQYVENQKRNLNRLLTDSQNQDSLPDQLFQETSWLNCIFEKLALLAIVYFIISIINSMAFASYKRKLESQHIQHL